MLMRKGDKNCKIDKTLEKDGRKKEGSKARRKVIKKKY